MDNLMVFNYKHQHVRAIKDENGDPWWVAKDVCDILELGNTSQAVSRLDNDEKNTIILRDGIRGNPSTIIVNEPGLYSLILRSDKPEAKNFKRWITHIVLPKIRKEGAFTMEPSRLIALALVEAKKVLEEKDEQIALMAPKAEFFDAVAESKDAIDMGRAAKVLGGSVGRTRLFQVLRDEGVLMTNNVPYQTFLDRGYFRVIEQKWSQPDGTVHVTTKTLVYQRGLDYIRKLLAKDNPA